MRVFCAAVLTLLIAASSTSSGGHGIWGALDGLPSAIAGDRAAQIVKRCMLDGCLNGMNLGLGASLGYFPEVDMVGVRAEDLLSELDALYEIDENADLPYREAFLLCAMKLSGAPLQERTRIREKMLRNPRSWYLN